MGRLDTANSQDRIIKPGSSSAPSPPRQVFSRRATRAIRRDAAILATATLIAWLLVFAFAGPSAAQSVLRFDDTSALAVSVNVDGTATIKVVVVNDGPTTPPVTYSIFPTGKSSADMDVEGDQATLPGYASTPIDVSITEIPTDGQTTADLVVSADQIGSAIRPLTLARPLDGGHYIRIIGIASIIGGFIFILIRFIFLWWIEHNTFGFDTRQGPAGWDFSKSWASNLTAAGALLGVVVAGTALPEQPHLLSKAQYGALNLYFGLVIAVAAYLYNAIVTKKHIPGDATKTPPVPASYQAEGFVWSYLVASFLTLWAVAGEIGTLYVMLIDILSQGRFPDLIVSELVTSRGGLLLIGMVIVLSLAAFYAWRTIGWNISYYKEPPPPAPGVAATPPAPLHRFSLL